MKFLALLCVVYTALCPSFGMNEAPCGGGGCKTVVNTTPQTSLGCLMNYPQLLGSRSIFSDRNVPVSYPQQYQSPSANIQQPYPSLPLLQYPLASNPEGIGSIFPVKFPKQAQNSAVNQLQPLTCSLNYPLQNSIPPVSYPQQYQSPSASNQQPYPSLLVQQYPPTNYQVGSRSIFPESFPNQALNSAVNLLQPLVPAVNYPLQNSIPPVSRPQQYQSPSASNQQPYPRSPLLQYPPGSYPEVNGSIFPVKFPKQALNSAVNQLQPLISAINYPLQNSVPPVSYTWQYPATPGIYAQHQVSPSYQQLSNTPVNSPEGSRTVPPVDFLQQEPSSLVSLQQYNSPLRKLLFNYVPEASRSIVSNFLPPAMKSLVTASPAPALQSELHYSPPAPELKSVLVHYIVPVRLAVVDGKTSGSRGINFNCPLEEGPLIVSPEAYYSKPYPFPLDSSWSSNLPTYSFSQQRPYYNLYNSYNPY